MAAEGLLKDLCEEATCSICLDFFRDPVTITECGHNFCQDCLTRSLEESGAAGASCCPQCRGKAQLSSLRPNKHLANIVEIAKKSSLLEGKRGVCEKHQEALKLFCKMDQAPLCQVCGVSKEHKENRAVVAGGKGGVCQKHQEPLKLFCKDDEALICVVCDRSKEHRYHETLPLEEASQEYKNRFCNQLEILKRERKRILAYKGDVEKESQDLLKLTEGEKQERVAKFRELHMFLEEQEKLLLAQIEDVEKEVARNRDQQLAELSAALSALESLIQEMEEKRQQSACEFLQDAQSTLQRCEEKEKFDNPVTFPLELKWRIWDFCDISPFLEGVLKQLKDTLDSGLPLHKAKVILDPDTAHPELDLSDDQKSVRIGGAVRALPYNPERFDLFHAVLGREGFTAGRHFWEILLGSVGRCTVGVARKSVMRNGWFSLSPEEGIWAVAKGGDKVWPSQMDTFCPLTLSGELKRVRVCLNYAGGRVAFFDADRAAFLYEFSDISFSGETLLPFFFVYSKADLKICS